MSDFDGILFWLKDPPTPHVDFFGGWHGRATREAAEVLMRDISANDLEMLGRHVGEVRKLEPRDDLSGLELLLRKHRAEAVGFHSLEGFISGWTP